MHIYSIYDSHMDPYRLSIYIYIYNMYMVYMSSMYLVCVHMYHVYQTGNKNGTLQFYNYIKSDTYQSGTFFKYMYVLFFQINFKI
jgi:hypothetical protein